MTYMQEITSKRDNPQHLEDIFQEAKRNQEIDLFSADMLACYTAEPENLLYQAWFYRLKNLSGEQKLREGLLAHWKLAVPLAILNGLVFWVLSDPDWHILDHLPVFLLLAAPVMAIFVMAFLSLSSRKQVPRTLGAGLGLVVAVVVALLLANAVMRISYTYYLDLMVPHLALLAWAAVGFALVGYRSNPDSRFAFVAKSIEVIVTGGVYLIAGIAFGAIVLGMFAALSVTLPDIWLRLIAAGGAGLLPVIAVATIYDPLVGPEAQDSRQGLSRFIQTMMRLLLPLTLGVLVVYLFVIPFNFLEPFINRDVLIVYNVMLFAIMGLLAGATPLDLEDMPVRLRSVLRYAILAVAVLAVLVSLYALSALLYRTVNGGITINRLTMIGWNIANIFLLFLIIYRLVRTSAQPWNERIKSVYSIGSVMYVFWTLFIILFTPFIFR